MSKLKLTHPDSWKVWGLGFVITLLCRVLPPAAFIEEFYSRGLFRAIRYGIDYTLGWLPFPVFYLFWGLLVYWIISWARSRRQSRSIAGGPWLTKLRTAVVFLMVLITVFLWAWGMNYGRVPVEKTMAFAPAQPTLEELRNLVHDEAAALSELRTQVKSDTFALTADHLPPDLEAAIRPLLAAALVRHGYPAPGRPRARQLLPRGVLLRFSTAGVYWPWAGEGNIDAGLHPLQRPAVMAHELAHAYGFGGEGTCSFWAWLTHLETDDPALEYTLRLGHWRRLAGRLRLAEPEAYWEWRAEKLAPGIRQDLQAIYDNAALYQDIAPALRDATYAAYLKAQGIHDGLLNYGRVVQLVEGYRRQYPTPQSYPPVQ